MVGQAVEIDTMFSMVNKTKPNSKEEALKPYIQLDQINKNKTF